MQYLYICNVRMFVCAGSYVLPKTGRYGSAAKAASVKESQSQIAVCQIKQHNH